MKKLILFLALVAIPIIAFSQSAGLQGRTVLGTLPRPEYNVDKDGIVVVSIWVDQYGNVKRAAVGAEGTTVTDSELWQAARNAALGAHFSADADAPELQQGTITYNFNLEGVKGNRTVSASAYLPEENRLKFKGIEISGDYKNFAQKLKDEGFTITTIREDGIVLRGSFAGYPKVMTVVTPDPSSKEVAAVTAFLKSDDTWSSLEDLFKRTIDLYTEKYGEPFEHVESFPKNVPTGTDGLKRMAVMDGNCDYKAIWILPEMNGSIHIAISYMTREFGVSIVYMDTENIQSRHQSILDDI